MSNYSRGRALEYRAVGLFSRAGYYTVRSAGSHGLVDLVALGPNKIIMVQCKDGSGRQSPSEKSGFKLLCRWLSADGVLFEHRRRGIYNVIDALSDARADYRIQMAR